MHDDFAGGADDVATAVESFGVVHEDDELFVFGGASSRAEFGVGWVGRELIPSIRIRREQAKHALGAERTEAPCGLGDLTPKLGCWAQP